VFHETKNSKKKLPVGFICHPAFYVGAGMKKGRIRIRDEQMFGSGLKLPESAMIQIIFPL
jgi:hypothetical protein